MMSLRELKQKLIARGKRAAQLDYIAEVFGEEDATGIFTDMLLGDKAASGATVQAGVAYKSASLRGGGFWGLDEKEVGDDSSVEVTPVDRQQQAMKALTEIWREERLARNERIQARTGAKQMDKVDTFWGQPVDYEYISLRERADIRGTMTNEQTDRMKEDVGHDKTKEYLKQALAADKPDPFWGTRKADRR
jgi:hypothetical protein